MFGEQPPELSDTETIDQKVWKKHQVHLKRLENHPLKKAEYYRQLKESTGVSSVRGLAEITGEDWSYIAKVFRILELPKGIRDFLISNSSPDIVKNFNLRCLLELVHLNDENLQYSRFREILNNFW